MNNYQSNYIAARNAYKKALKKSFGVIQDIIDGLGSDFCECHRNEVFERAESQFNVGELRSKLRETEHKLITWGKIHSLQNFDSPFVGLDFSVTGSKRQDLIEILLEKNKKSIIL